MNEQQLRQQALNVAQMMAARNPESTIEDILEYADKVLTWLRASASAGEGEAVTEA